MAMVAAMVRVMALVEVTDMNIALQVLDTTISGITYKMPSLSSTTDTSRLSNPYFDPLVWYVADAVMHGFGYGINPTFYYGNGSSYTYGHENGNGYGYGPSVSWLYGNGKGYGSFYGNPVGGSRGGGVGYEGRLRRGIHF